MEMMERIKLENDKLREMVMDAMLSLTGEERRLLLQTIRDGEAVLTSRAGS